MADNEKLLFPLTPLQELLFLDARARGGNAIDHLKFTIKGNVSDANIADAWARVTTHHQAMRCAFRWNDQPKPMQAEDPECKARICFLNAPGANIRDAEEAIDRHQLDVAQGGLDIQKAPLISIASCRFENDERRILISYRPAMFDGWSIALVIRDFLHALGGAIERRVIDLAPTRQFHTYVQWLQESDNRGANSFWRDYLGDVSAPTTIAVDRINIDQSTSPDFREERSFVLSRSTRALRDMAQFHKITANCIIQSAWAVLLAAYARTQDIIFATAVSGRSRGVQDIDAIVGVFFNNLPLRLKVAPTVSVVEFLRNTHKALTAIQEFEATSPALIRNCTRLPAHAPLYHSIVLYHNFPLKGTFWEEGRAFKISDIHKPIETNLPLTLVCVPELNHQLRLIYDARLITALTAKKYLDDLEIILQCLIERPDAPLREAIEAVIAPPGQPLSCASPSPPRSDRPSDTEEITEFERDIAAIFESILGTDHLGPNDNFFDLGARSLQLVQAAAQLNAAGYSGFSVIDIFEHPTIRKLAMRIEGKSNAGPTRLNTAAKRISAARAARARRRQSAPSGRT